MLASGRKRTLLWRGLQITVIGLIFAFLLRNLYSSWNQISAYDWSLDYPAFAIACSLMLLASSFYAYLWKLILVRLGNPLSYRKGFRIFFLSQLGRYIPGKIWGILGLVYLSGREGITQAVSGASMILQLILQVVSGVMLFVLTLPFWKEIPAWSGLYAVLLFFPLGLLLLHPTFLGRGLNFALRLVGQRPVDLNWGYGYLLGQLALWGSFWIIQGLASYHLIKAISNSPPPFPVVTGIFAIAWVVGFVSLLTPSGLGVVEGTLTLLLGFYLPLYMATIIALLSRLLRTAGDLIYAAIAWKL